MLTVVEKIYMGILVDKFCRVIGGLIDDKQGSFRKRRGFVDQIFTQNEIGESNREKKQRVCGFYRFVEGVQ